MTEIKESQEGDRTGDNQNQKDGQLVTSRRAVIATLGTSGGLTALASSQTSSTGGALGIGGGPMSDELSHLDIRWYEGSEDELPDAGVKGRFFRVTAGGSTWDTGDVLHDDGSSWGKIDVGFGSVRTEDVNSVRVAQPGGVQTAIDDVSDNGGGRVELCPDGDYDPSVPWEVYEGVTLDFNGATITLTADTDVIIIHGGAQILRPKIDFSGVGGYTSNVFVIDTDVSDSPFGSQNETLVQGGETTGVIGEGTVFYLHQNGDSNRVTFFNALNHRAVRCDTAIEIHSEHSAGWINTNTFSGSFAQARQVIHQHGPGGNKYNEFEFSYQPNTSDGSDLFWLLKGAKSEGNVYSGVLWDTHSFTDVVWRIDADVDENNLLESRTPIDVETDIDNQSSTRQSVTTTDRPRISPGTATGDDAYAADSRNTAIGNSAEALDGRSTALGGSSVANDAATVVGQSAEGTGTASTVLGRGSSAPATYAGVFGYNNSNDVSRTVRIGDGTYIRQLYMAASSKMADSEIPDEHLTIELDETNGGFLIRGRDSGGVYHESLLNW